MATPGVIEHLDVVEDIGPGLIARRIDLSANAFSLEQLKEALCDCVVMAVAAPAHAAHQVVVAQESLHPYGMQRLIKARGKDEVINVAQRTSLYQTIQRLEREDLIRQQMTTRDEGRPERTVYEITDSGR